MYEEYMQNVMGMQMNPYENTYGDQMMGYNSYGVMQPYGFTQMDARSANPQVDLENMYPELYNIVYPMVKKACNRNTRPVTSELIDEMTQDIYSNIEADNIVSLNINVENMGNTNNRSVENKNAEIKTTEDRNFRRGPIADLIKILLIRELIDRRPGWGPRPPMPPRPPRPGPCRPGEWNNDCFPPRPPMPRY